MKTTIFDAVIAINVVGLAGMSTLEAWRPGSVSMAVNVGLVWLVAAGLIGLAVVAKKSAPAQ